MALNWMQWYELAGCAALIAVCLRIISLHEMPKPTRWFALILGISGIVRCGALVAKYSDTPNLSKTLIAIVAGNIPLMTAALLASIVWQQIRARVVRDDDYERGSSDAR